MKKSDVMRALESIAPLKYQEEWDNSGIQIDMGQDNINKIIVTLDVTSEVVEEAIAKKADMIVSHHPLLFNGVKRIEPEDVVGNYILRLVRAGISVYSAHTCFDSAPGGNNDYLMRKIGVPNCFRLPIPGLCIADCNMARVGTLPSPMFFGQFCNQVNEALHHPGALKTIGTPEKLVQKIAVCTGAGSEFYEAALAFGADVFISGEIKHHEALAAKEQGLCIIDAGHFGTEWIFVENMAHQLKKIGGSDLDVVETAFCNNPFDAIYD